MNVFAEDFADGDLLPMEVTRDLLQMLLSIAAGGTEEEDAANLAHLDPLQQELIGLIWARYNHLLQEILEQFIHLVLLQVRLDRLHVVELLHLVHRVFFSVTKSSSDH